MEESLVVLQHQNTWLGSSWFSCGVVMLWYQHLWHMTSFLLVFDTFNTNTYLWSCFTTLCGQSNWNCSDLSNYLRRMATWLILETETNIEPPRNKNLSNCWTHLATCQYLLHIGENIGGLCGFGWSCFKLQSCVWKGQIQLGVSQRKCLCCWKYQVGKIWVCECLNLAEIIQLYFPCVPGQCDQNEWKDYPFKGHRQWSKI